VTGTSHAGETVGGQDNISYSSPPYDLLGSGGEPVQAFAGFLINLGK
jgi:hypothetical protein